MSGISAEASVPVFPLTDFVLFPRVQAPLHIFEPRYKEMIDDVIDHTGRFCMATLRGDSTDETHPAFYEVGCLCELSDYSRLDDGRYNVVVRGLSRVAMSEVASDRQYRCVSAKPAKVTGLSQVSAEHKHVLRILSECLISGPLEPFPLAKSYLKDLDLESLLDLMAFYANLPVEEHQKLLETTAMDALAERLVDVYEE